MQAQGWNGSYFHTTRVAATKAYDEAGITDPRAQLSLIEVHDCFSVTELVTMEDLHISRSEEHTSELQSLMRISYAVFCLKKKKKNNKNTMTNINSTIRSRTYTPT